MSIDHQISEARQKIHREGYDMSFGELISLYKRKELIISPEFQRLFRWDETQKTRFIESLLLNIPIPPIFIFTRSDGKWELVDGLQRISTILQFTGNLIDAEDQPVEPFVCEGTRAVPDLSGMRWPTNSDDEGEDSILPPVHQLTIQRSRVRMEILDKETDANTKFELFQRLNTGGTRLSEQEVRNCTIYSLNEKVFNAINSMAAYQPFRDSIGITDSKIEAAFDKELVVRFLVYRNIEYKRGMDVHEYLDQGMINICQNKRFDFEQETTIFKKTFSAINGALSENAFKPYVKKRFVGNFSLAAFECMTLGVSRLFEEYEEVESRHIVNCVHDMWKDNTFNKNRGAGIRGTQRLVNLVLPKAREFFE